MPAIPTLPQLQLPILNLFIAAVGAVLVVWMLSRLLPKTALYAHFKGVRIPRTPFALLARIFHTLNGFERLCFSDASLLRRPFRVHAG